MRLPCASSGQKNRSYFSRRPFLTGTLNGSMHFVPNHSVTDCRDGPVGKLLVGRRHHVTLLARLPNDRRVIPYMISTSATTPAFPWWRCRCLRSLTGPPLISASDEVDSRRIRPSGHVDRANRTTCPVRQQRCANSSRLHHRGQISDLTTRSDGVGRASRSAFQV